MATKLLIFGVTGDLSTRKLLPALDTIIRTGEFDDMEIIGVSRREVDVTELLHRSLGSDVLADRMSIFSMNVADLADYERLCRHMSLAESDQLLVYLSVPPTAAGQIVDFLGEAGINTPNVKLLFEKPFGVDLVSAQEVIARAARYYHDEQLYRIDHYLAKEMAQNIVAFRAGNALFDHVWSHRSIEKIEIVALETIGVEGRAGFYEQTGALRDVVQGHLMQLLALILMDIPAELDWDVLPELRLKALQSLRLADPRQAVRAQYDTYAQEVSNPGSLAETFVSVGLESDAPAWREVPIQLTTGKALDHKTTEIRIYFKKRHVTQSNCLTFRIHPNEGVEIELFTKKPGYERAFEPRRLAFAYPDDAVLPDAYEQVLVDAIRSRKSLFTSSDEVLACWRVLQPLQASWEMDDSSLKTYAVGSAADDVVSQH
jgi:glucose-6-phosphate 1-dehydrogenase